MMHVDDVNLIEKIKTGDKIAFRRLVEKYQPKLYRLALDLTSDPDDAEDLSQEVFIKIFKNIQQFRMESQVSSWLYRIAVNTYLSKKRLKIFSIIKSERKFIKSDGVLTEIPDDRAALNTERQAASALLQQRIQAALSKLSTREKVVFVLRHYHDYTMKEIARDLRLAEGTVKSLLFRAIKKMQVALTPFKNELGLEDLQ
ncbi:sigma-70 family RNA polymerase sigma factor [candidate division KSB1 bacterium]|nr:sigma-70 family RNA polymerase sigma factor [candidate division KSB1 bacterium]